MTVEIRPFQDSDYVDFVAAYNTLNPAEPRSVLEFRYLDGRRTEPYGHGRLLALEGGRVTGWGEYTQSAASYHPQKFSLEIATLARSFQKNLAADLYRRLHEALTPCAPLAYEVSVREDAPAYLDFYTARGFREVQRNWALQLALETFEPAPYTELLKRLDREGYTFRTFAELEENAGTTRLLYELLQELVVEVPSPEPRRPWSFEQFMQHRQNSPVLLPACSFAVGQDDLLVGFSELKRSGMPGRLVSSLTGTRAAFRGRGLALAAKLKALVCAKEAGFQTVISRNAASNAGMLALNEALGFVRGVARIDMAKRLNN